MELVGIADLPADLAHRKICDLEKFGSFFHTVLRNRESEANGPWTDVRAVSEILYECLTGKSPLQAGCLWNKKKIRSVSIWTTVSSRVDETLLRELNYGIGGGCFGFYALAEQLGMQNEPLAVYLGAIQSVWGESWLNLTEKYQKEAYLDEEHAFLTRKQWRNILNITGIFLVSIAVAGCVGFWYTHTHERQILEWQIQKDRTKYHRISGKETDGFAIGDIHLKKLMEQTLGKKPQFLFGDALSGKLYLCIAGKSRKRADRNFQ